MIRVSLGILIFLNLFFILESVITHFTGYQVFVFNDPNYKWDLYLLRGTIIGTLFLLALTLRRILSPPKNSPQVRRSKKQRIFSLAAFLSILVYVCLSLSYWLFSEFSFAEVLKQTIYYAPSHRRAVIFKNIQYPHQNINVAYQKRGIFQKRAFMKVTSQDFQSTSLSSEIPNKVLDQLHEPSYVEITWSEDERSLIWKIKTESSSAEGVVMF